MSFKAFLKSCLMEYFIITTCVTAVIAVLGLSLRQALLRKLLHVIVLEAMLIAFGFYTGILHNPVEASLFGLTVLVVYIAVNLISWLFDKKEASEINRTLKSLQTRHQDDSMGLG